MSSPANYKWKFKRDRKKCVKPYERPNSETWITRVTNTIKDNIIPNWMINVTNYLSSSVVPVSENNDLSKLEDKKINEIHKGSVVLNDESRKESENVFPTECSLMTNEPGVLQEQQLNNKLIDSNKKKVTKLEALNPWNCVIASTSKALNNEVREEDGSSTTENTASSTSGCSSLVPSHQYHLQKLCLPIDKEGLEKLRKELLRKTRDVAVETDTKSTNFKSEENGNKRSFLWSESSSNNRPSVSELFKSSSLNTSLRKSNSPFYDGKTSFGGTSAKQASLLASFTKSQKVAPLIRVKVSENKKIDASENLSDAAKRILANIEKISSPLEDAKKIPLYGSINTNEYLIEPNKPFHRNSKNATSTPLTSPIIPCKSSTKKPQLKWFYLDQTKEDVNLNKASTFIPSNNLQPAPGGGKIKSSRVSKSGLASRNVMGRNENQSIDYHESVNLSLPIANLPTFNFGDLDKSNKFSYNNVNDITCNKSRPTTTIVKVSDENQVSIDTEFKFSLPIPASQQFTQSLVNCNDVDISKEKTESMEKNLNKDNKIVPKDSSKENFVLKSKKKISADILLDELEQEDSTKQENNSIVSKKIKWTEPLKPSSDFYSSTSIIKTSKNNKSNTIIDNKQDTTNNDSVKIDLNSSTNKQESTSINTNSIFNKFKPLPGSWICSTCLVNNSSDKLKCIACEVPKPGENLVSTVTQLSPPKSFASFSSNSDLKNEGFPKLVTDSCSLEKENQNSSSTKEGFVFFASNNLKSNSTPFSNFDKSSTGEPFVNKSNNFFPISTTTITTTAVASVVTNAITSTATTSTITTTSSDKDTFKFIPKLSFDSSSINFTSSLNEQPKEKSLVQSSDQLKKESINIDQDSNLKKSQTNVSPLTPLGDSSSSSIMNVETFEDKLINSIDSKVESNINSSKSENLPNQNLDSFNPVNVFTFGNKTQSPAIIKESPNQLMSLSKPSSGFGFDKASTNSGGFTFGLDTKHTSTGFGFNAKPAKSTSTFSFGNNTNNNDIVINNMASTSTLSKTSTESVASSKGIIFDSRSNMPSLSFNVDNESSKGSENFKSSSIASTIPEVKFSMSGQPSQNTSQPSTPKFFSLPTKTTFPSVTTHSSTLVPSTIASTFSFGFSQNKTNGFSFTPKSTIQPSSMQSGFNFDVKTSTSAATTSSNSMMNTISTQPSFTFGNTALSTSNQPTGVNFVQSSSSNNQFVFGLSSNNAPSTISHVSSEIGSNASEPFKSNNLFSSAPVNFAFGSTLQAQPTSQNQPALVENSIFSFTDVDSRDQSNEPMTTHPSSVPQLNFLQTPSFNFAGNSAPAQGAPFQFSASSTTDLALGTIKRNIKKAKRRLN